MSCNAFIYTYNPSTQAVTLTAAQPTAVLGLGTSHGFNPCGRRVLSLAGNAVRLGAMGWYSIDASVVFTPAAAGLYTVSVYRDGVAIPGASQTVTAVAGGTVSVTIPAGVRNTCCDTDSELTVVISTTAALPATVAVNNVGVTVEKL